MKNNVTCEQFWFASAFNVSSQKAIRITICLFAQGQLSEDQEDALEQSHNLLPPPSEHWH